MGAVKTSIKKTNFLQCLVAGFLLLSILRSLRSLGGCDFDGMGKEISYNNDPSHIRTTQEGNPNPIEPPIPHKHRATNTVPATTTTEGQPSQALETTPTAAVSHSVPQPAHGGVEQDQCPSVIRKKVGLFNEETSSSPLKDDFKDTILLVSSNYAYYNMLQNWEYLANELGLKWAVLALDERLYEELGPEKAVAANHSFSVSGAQSFRRRDFSTLTCNKMRMAHDITTKCKVNVVFSDADNIFFKNPFEHDLGRLIRSKRYDYLYQPNHPAKEPRKDRCIQGQPRKESNTGFYYISHGNEVYKRVLEATLEKCQGEGNVIDDQTLFWESFWKLKNEIEGSKKGNFHHCGSEEYDNPDVFLTKASFMWCCVDPYYYPIGSGLNNRDPVTYHANWVGGRGYDGKVEKLSNIRPDKHGWNQSRFKDGVGGILRLDDATNATR